MSRTIFELIVKKDYRKLINIKELCDIKKKLVSKLNDELFTWDTLEDLVRL